MKRTNVTLTLALLVAACLQPSMTRAQGGDCAPSECEEKPRPYRYCDGAGNIVSICAVDPFNPGDGISTSEASFLTKLGLSASSLKPLKLPLPICFSFRGDGPETMTGSNCEWDPVAQRIVNCKKGNVTYERSDFVRDMNAAAARWNCICGLQSAPCGCEITIGFTSNTDRFGDPVTQPSTNSVEDALRAGASAVGGSTYDATKGPIREDCRIECDSITIELNNTASFQRSWLSSSHTDANWDVEWTGVTKTTNDLNLVVGISREIGRLLNASLNHQDKTLAGTPEKGCTEGCETSKSLTDYEYGNEVTRPVPECERCMMQRLYCPDGPLNVQPACVEGRSRKVGAFIDDEGILVVSVSGGRPDMVALFDAHGKAVARTLTLGRTRLEFSTKGLGAGVYVVAAYSNGVLHGSSAVVVSK